jgi:ABC-2 type transport system ATP-binding protein
MSAVLTLRDVSKSYGFVRALNGVSFEVPKGSVFGILGPNGSGKTTLLGIVMDVLHPSTGDFLWMGHPGSQRSLRRHIGTLLETPNFYHYLSGEENLRIAAGIKQRGREDIDKVLEQVNLLQRKKSKFNTYSLGMKQRLAIASCLLGDPEVLIFDEPTNGLDPSGIAEIRQLMRDLHNSGKTIIMASHLLDEVEKVCTHVAILKNGNLISTGEVANILSNEEIIEVSSDNVVLLSNILNNFDGVSRIEKTDKSLLVFFPSGASDAGKLNAFCFQNGIILTHLSSKRKSLESRFFELTNNK